MDYMNFNEQDLEQMFDELNKIVAKLSFETNQKKCDIIYNQYRELVSEIKDLIIGCLTSCRKKRLNCLKKSTKAKPT